VSCVREVQTEDVSLGVTLYGAQLDAGNDANAEGRARRGRGGDSVERVMVRESDRRQADALRLPNDFVRRARAVGGGGMHVQIDERGGVPGARSRRRHTE
jgi:hypothetical protein